MENSIENATQHHDLGDLVVADGSLIDSVFFMHWADYRSNLNKAKLDLSMSSRDAQNYSMKKNMTQLLEIING